MSKDEPHIQLTGSLMVSLSNHERNQEAHYERSKGLTMSRY